MKNYLKEELRHLPFFLSLIVVFYAVSVVATEYLFSSSEVNYDNTRSNMAANNVQDAVDELYSCATDFVAIQNQIDALADGLNNIDFSEIEDQVSALSNKIYPVGSIYISVTDSTASAVHDRLGGTWVAFGEGRTIVGVGTGTDANSTQKVFASNETGGEYTHTLSIDEMPSHTHTFTGTRTTTENAGSHSHTVPSIGHVYSTSSDTCWGCGSYRADFEGDKRPPTTTDGNHSHYFTPSGTNAATGGSQAHNNVQPYITVYMWKRTA